MAIEYGRNSVCQTRSVIWDNATDSKGSIQPNTTEKLLNKSDYFRLLLLENFQVRRTRNQYNWARTKMIALKK